MLSFRPTPYARPEWHARGLNYLNSHAYDHKDYDELRASLDALAEAHDCMSRQMATAAYQRPYREVQAHIEQAAGELINECWRWDDDREDRAHRNSLDWQRMVREA